MVGVAGKSQACNTCRQRKIACSLQKPQCAQCLKSNRICSGYRRKRVFILHQERPGTIQANSKPSLGPTKSNLLPDRVPDDALRSSKSKDRTRLTPYADRYLRANNDLSPVAYRKQLVNAFICSHVPLHQLGPVDEKPWLLLLPDLPVPTAALETSTLAIATAKLGRLNHDEVLVKESLRLYTKGLRELQLALWNPELMHKDETLAACMVLGMYELVECPAGDKTGYISHYNGCDRLVELRGPDAHREGLGHQLFLTFRVQGVLQALEHHCPSYLMTPTWTQQPWSIVPKGQFDQLFDIFQKGPAIFQQADMLKHVDADTQLAIGLEVAKQCWKLDTELASFYATLEGSTLGPLYWPEFSIDKDSPEDPELGKVFPVAYHFVNLGIARTVMFYWANLTMLYNGLSALYQLLYSIQEVTGFDIKTLPCLGHRADYLTPARNVCQGVEYCLQDEMLDIGPVLVVAPLAIVVETLKEYPSFRRECAWAKLVFARIYAGGMRILN